MMENVQLLPKKMFELKLSDGTTVTGKFGTWALKRFTEKKKISLQKVSEFFSDVSLADAMDYVLCAIESEDRKAGRPLEFNDIKLSEWVDDNGGLVSLMTLINHSSDPEEKKSEPENSEIA